MGLRFKRQEMEKEGESFNVNANPLWRDVTGIEIPAGDFGQRILSGGARALMNSWLKKGEGLKEKAFCRRILTSLNNRKRLNWCCLDMVYNLGPISKMMPVV